MGYKFNPFTGNFDTTDSPDGVFESVQVNGDINLDDGGTFATTLQLITPTANRTISFPDATGTVALVGGSSGQLVYNNAGAYAGAPSTSVGATGNITLSLAGAASTPPVSLTGTWFSGGTSTTTKPQLLIEPNGTTSTAWSTSGTGLGVNAASGFGGNLLDLQVNGTSNFKVSSAGAVNGGAATFSTLTVGPLNIQTRGNGGTGAGGYGFWFFNENGDSTGNIKVGIINSGGGNYGYGYLVANDGIGYIGFGDVFNGQIRAGFYSPTSDTIEQRRTTNAQAFRCYGTYTDASNYVRASLSSTSTAVTLAAETAGTGADDIPLNLTAAGAGTVKVNSVAEVAVSSTVAGLPATPAVGMLTRVTDATAPAVGLTVTGGGSAAALVWYNGTNWTVLGV